MNTLRDAAAGKRTPHRAPRDLSAVSRYARTAVFATIATSLSGAAWGAACVSGAVISNGITCDLPANTAITIELWGGGGGGARTNGPDPSNPAYTGGAGGGGGYCKYTVTTTAGTDTLVASAGAGGPAGTQSNFLTDGAPGGSSSAEYIPNGGPSILMTAGGGSGGELGDVNGSASSNGTGGAGGSGCATTGSFVGFDGGKGGDGVYFGAGANAGGGGGGSSAGTGSAGRAGGNGLVSDASNTTHGAGGDAPSGGGAGGAGAGEVASNTRQSAAGSAPGGGGGGGGTSSPDGALAPSDGAAGRVVVSWGGGADTTPPATPTLSIDGGAASTGSTSVTLTITGDTDDIGVTGWYLSETNSAPSAGAGGWLATRPTSATLSSGDGTKTLYLWTKDAAGNLSGAGSDSIVYAASVVNGVCGTRNGSGVSSAPSQNLCAAGTASSVSGSGPWSWSCSGQNGGTSASCSASVYTPPPLPVDGACGSSLGGSFSSAPSQGLCGTGVASGVADDGRWRWSCAGQNGGVTAQCSAAHTAVDGACGSADGGTTPIPPDQLQFCASGERTDFTGGIRGPWSWSCSGVFGGEFARCAADWGDDTRAPTASMADAFAGDTTVTLLVSDDRGVAYIDFTSVEVNSVAFNGTPVSTAFTTDATAGSVTIPLPEALAEGDTVVVAFDIADLVGNTANLEMTVTAEARVALTVASPIAQLPRGTREQALSTLTIRELVAGALTSGTIRIVAPGGVRFAGATYGGIASANAREVSTTVSADDTLMVDLTVTGAIDSATITPMVIVSNRASGVLNFDLFDGDLAGDGGIGIAQASGTLGYAGNLEPLTGSADDASLVVGETTTIQIAGGMGPYTAISSDEGLATVGVTDSTATVTAVAMGSPTITLTDALGTSVEVALDVASSPFVLEGAPVSCPEQPGGECLHVTGTITANPADLDRPGAIYVVATFPPSHGGAVFLLSPTEGWLDYDPTATKRQYYSIVPNLGVMPIDLGTIPLDLMRALTGLQFTLGYGRGSVVFGDPWSDMIAGGTHGAAGTIQSDGSIR